MGWWRREDGAGSGEYVAVLTVVAGLVAAVLALSVAPTVGAWGRYATCLLFTAGDTGCEPPGPDTATSAQDDPAGPPVCTVDTSSWDSRATTDWIFERSVEGERYLISELSDGSVAIIDTRYEGSGKVVGVAAEIPIAVGKGQDGSGKLGVSATGAAVAFEEAGRLFVLDEAAYADYQELMAAIARDLYINHDRYAAMELGLGAGSHQERLDDQHALALREYAVRNLIEEHATHDYHRSFGEVTVELGAAKGIYGVEVAVEGSTGAVVAVDRETGDYTVTVELDAATAGGVSAGLLGVGASGEVGGSRGAWIELAYTADHALVGATVVASGELGAEGSAGLDPGSIPGAPDGTGGRVGVRLAGAGRIEASYSLPLGDDPDGQRHLAAFLADPTAHVGDFIDVAGRHGEVLVQGYQVTETTEQAGAALRIVASAGYEQVDSHRQLALVDAVSYDPVNGLLHRGDCLS